MKINEYMHVYIYLHEWPPENSVCGYWALDNGPILILGIGTGNRKQTSQSEDETKQASD